MVVAMVALTSMNHKPTALIPLHVIIDKYTISLLDPSLAS